MDDKLYIISVKSAFLFSISFSDLFKSSRLLLVFSMVCRYHIKFFSSVEYILVCSSIIILTFSIVVTASSVLLFSSLIIWFISSAKSVDCSASFLISLATTAKPLPASPLPFSIAAFRARSPVYQLYFLSLHWLFQYYLRFYLYFYNVKYISAFWLLLFY